MEEERGGGGAGSRRRRRGRRKAGRIQRIENGKRSERTMEKARKKIE